MDQVHVVRHQVLVEGRSQRQVAKALGISRRTVRKYLTESVPILRETGPRHRPVWEAVSALRPVRRSLRECFCERGSAQIEPAQLAADRDPDRL